MAKSRKGKKASLNIMYETMKKCFNEKLNSVSCDIRPKVYLTILDWINNQAPTPHKDILIKALNDCEKSLECQLKIGLDNALNKLKKRD